jgi:hypothetical protein
MQGKAIVARAIRTVLAASLVALAPAVLAQVRTGSEFRVNTFTLGFQEYAAVAATPSGGFVVVWLSVGQDGFGGQGVYGQRFDSTGAPAGLEFQVPNYTAGAQRDPAIATAADGSFVVVWESGRDGHGTGIFGRRHDSSGTPLAEEFQVNVYTTFNQASPELVVLSDGSFVVVWESPQDGGASLGVFARRFDSTGAAVASEFQANTYTSAAQAQATVAASSDDAFVIAWTSNGQDRGGNGVFAQRFDSSGARQGSEFQVNSFTVEAQSNPSAAPAEGGAFVVVWESGLLDGADYGVAARRFDSAGGPINTEFLVNAFTSGAQRVPRVSAMAGGGFIVVWQSEGRDGNGYGIAARAFDGEGGAQTVELAVNTYTTENQTFPAVAATATGGFVVVWDNSSATPGPESSLDGVFGQRYEPSSVLDVDGNGIFDPLTDGLLLLRYFFGFRGGSLTVGAVGGGCARCDAMLIEAFIASNHSSYDIDDDELIEALTDGLLLLRYAFGFRGPTLIASAVGSECIRCEAPDIEAYIAGLL